METTKSTTEPQHTHATRSEKQACMLSFGKCWDNPYLVPFAPHLGANRRIMRPQDYYPPDYKYDK